MLVETDDGLALVKYMGNPQGEDALVSEFIAASLAELLDVPIPPFCVMTIGAVELAKAFTQTEAGPAFVSQWQADATNFSPSSSLLELTTNKAVLSQIVVFDTWIKNDDRFSVRGQVTASNYDNLLFLPDGSKVRVCLIDHTHAFVKTTFEDEMNGVDWAGEREVYGLFPSFDKFLDESAVNATLDAICSIDSDDLLAILSELPSEWGVTSKMKDCIASDLIARAAELGDWLPNVLFRQGQLNVRGNA